MRRRPAAQAPSKDFEKLARSDRQLFERVDAALTRLVQEPTAGKPLQGPLAGLRSLRVGDLRIIYRHDVQTACHLTYANSRGYLNTTQSSGSRVYSRFCQAATRCAMAM
ncbi:MAG TPA: type II toxin-antitoxin system RelE/ParE family toxin [Thermoanaerobaculia bacterium]|nr:type II toxin-antitoxin system RelE/ParE family toxin [Thermoanaerobaculia bacterium]